MTRPATSSDATGAPLGESLINALLSTAILFFLWVDSYPLLVTALVLNLVWIFYRGLRRPTSYDPKQTSGAKTATCFLLLIALGFCAFYLIIATGWTLVPSLVACLCFFLAFFAISKALLPANYIEPAP